MLVDTHVHLTEEIFRGRVPEVLERARSAGVGAFVVPAYDEDSLDAVTQVSAAHDGVVPAFGIHPWFLKDPLPVDRLASLCREHGAVAVGEIGLDFARPCLPADVQERAFRRQLELAAGLGLPVIVHSRRAVDRVLAIVRELGSGLKGVMHSFPGGPDLALRFVDLGFFIGFSGSVTRKGARRYHHAARVVPLDRILVETDAPSIALEGIDAERVEPCHTVEVARAVAALRQVPFETVVEATTRNARALFGIAGTEGDGSS